MFEVPEAKRIRRSEVFEDDDSASDAELEAATTIEGIKAAVGMDYHFDYDLVESDLGKTKFANLQVHGLTGPAKKTHEEEEAFEFRLFSRPKSSDAEGTGKKEQSIPTKINIRSPTPDQSSDGRFTNPYRPLSFYFTTSPPVDSLAAAAVSGEEILQHSQDIWPGCQLPWRVIHLPHTGTKLSSSTKVGLKVKDNVAMRKGKPSKRRRILLRTRTKMVEEKAKEKEEHLREKKTRLNREKKLKRKAKEKAMKADQKGKEGKMYED